MKKTNKMADKKIWKCGILAINKPKNITCAKLVDEVKFILFNRNNQLNDWLKMGHGGTIDASATGVLVIGTGLGCKLLTKFLQGPKAYRVDALFGTETDTLNDTGKIVNQKPYSHITESNLEQQLHQFLGNTLQVAPAYSALKIGGRRSSDLAMEGAEVPLKSRLVTCYSAKLTHFDLPKFSLEISCGGGFYVRSLIRDLGHRLGTCAHITDLHRTRHGLFTDKDTLSKEHWTYENLLENAKMNLQRKELRGIVKSLREYRPQERKSNVWFDPT